jgi:hypothetical protein
MAGFNGGRKTKSAKLQHKVFPPEADPAASATLSGDMRESFSFSASHIFLLGGSALRFARGGTFCALRFALI